MSLSTSITGFPVLATIFKEFVPPELSFLLDMKEHVVVGLLDEENDKQISVLFVAIGAAGILSAG